VAISINPQTFVIYVPKSDMTLIQSTPLEIRELDLNWFRLALKAYEAAEYGIYLYKTHDHNTEVVLGSLTFARVIEILEPYTVTFEDGQYAINLVNANSNVADRVNVNQVSVRSFNSAGLSAPVVTNADYQAIAAAVWDKLTTDHEAENTFGQKLGRKVLTTSKFVALK